MDPAHDEEMKASELMQQEDTPDDHETKQPQDDVGDSQPPVASSEEEMALDKATCMICMLIMVEPCTLPCHHSFCIQCVNKMF